MTSRKDTEVFSAMMGHMTRAQESNNRMWQVLGVAGAAVALVVAVVQSFPVDARQPREFLFAAPIVVAALMVLRWLFPSAWMTFRSRPELLVPIGLVVLASTTIELVAVLPAVGTLFIPSWTTSFLGLSLGLSLGTVLQMIVRTGFAAWQTDLLWRFAQGDSAPDLAPWIPIRKHFLRAFAALATGVGVLLACIVPAVALGSMAMVVGVFAMLMIGIVWNLVTVALLPTVMYYPRPLLSALGAGLARSWMLKGRLWQPLAAQLVLLGLVVMVRAHFTATTPTTDRGSPVTSVSQESKTNVKWQVNAFWVGGYENHCRWFSQYAAALETPQVALITEALAILFLVVAAAMKWTVIGALIGPVSEAPSHVPAPGLLKKPPPDNDNFAFRTRASFASAAD